MALKNLKELRQEESLKFTKTYWKEVTLSSDLKSKLEGILPNLIKLDQKNGTVTTGDNNIIIFPYQYFAFIVAVKDLLFALKDYFDIFKELSNLYNQQIRYNTQFAEIIFDMGQSGIKDYSSLQSYCLRKGNDYLIFLNLFEQRIEDGLSRDLFCKFISDNDYRGGKEIAPIFKGLLNVTFIELDKKIKEHKPYKDNKERQYVLMGTSNETNTSEVCAERKPIPKEVEAFFSGELTKKEKRGMDKGLKEVEQIRQGKIKEVEFDEFLETLDKVKVPDMSNFGDAADWQKEQRQDRVLPLDGMGNVK